MDKGQDSVIPLLASVVMRIQTPLVKNVGYFDASQLHQINSLIALSELIWLILQCLHDLVCCYDGEEFFLLLDTGLEEGVWSDQPISSLKVTYDFVLPLGF